LPILKLALTERHREDLPLWVEKTWIALGGPACVENESDLQDAKIFFSLLRKLTQNETSLGLKWTSLEEALKQLYAQATTAAGCRIQIMTIHNAKGLEFDTVILPHLEKGSGKDDKPLLTWLERPLVNNTTALLLAPIHAIGSEEDKIYKHIRRQDKNKTQHEQGRLLYVAATRAKKTLHLCLSLETKEPGEFKTPTDSSMLKKIWPTIQHELAPHALQLTSLASENKEKGLTIKRLPTQWTHPLSFKPAPERPVHNKIQGFHLPEADIQIAGTVVHYLLQQISRFGFAWWNNKSALEHQAYIKNQLIKNGALPQETQKALEKVEKAILNTLADPRGQWLLGKQSEAQAELALAAVLKGKAKMLIIDRTFVDEKGFRWIIDYKTAAPEKEELSAFLKTEKEKYAAKMQDYQQALAFLDQRPIRLGLYFPLVPAWCEWDNKDI
jgi:ATP-dependent helicase/nuclease subunit A